MGAFVVYLLKSSLLLALFVSLFMMLMSKETFHRLNRCALLFVVLLSLSLPLVNIGVETPFSSLFAKVGDTFTEKEYIMTVEPESVVSLPVAVPEFSAESFIMDDETLSLPLSCFFQLQYYW